jgi:electron transfer flavoprotein alpha subunit
MTNETTRSVWVFGDYRNYFQNRVTLQLISRAMDLSQKIGAEACVVVLGYEVDEWVGEYVAHGANKVYVTDHPSLRHYNVETYTNLLARMVTHHDPEILLIGATIFGREMAPRLAKRLQTGLTADCVGLDINDEGLLVQTAPSFGGNLLADIITPDHRPQMATVRPGVFQEIPHDYVRTGEIIRVPLPDDLPVPRARLVSVERPTQRGRNIEDAPIVICGGRGMGSKKKFSRLFELAGLLDAEVGATRPVVYEDWIGQEALVGQAGRHIKPQILFSFGISGAIQHTAGCNDARFIIAINKNPNATMMKMADLAIVADASQFCVALINELKRRIR